MSYWKKHYESVKKVCSDQVMCYMDGWFEILKWSGYDHNSNDGSFVKTCVLRCGSMDGEYMDLFQLQKWFDDNREWINELKKEIDADVSND